MIVHKSTPLFQIHTDIDERVRLIREGHPEWLCGKGCDNCCRRLAEGLATLPPEQLADIGRHMLELAETPSHPVVCPMLDRTTGACPVYLHRPVACRTYGFYIERNLGLYCGDIEALVAQGALPDVVWGNQDAIDRRLGSLGESRPLTEWFAGYASGSEQSL